MSRHETRYVISYHGILCHDMSYVTTIVASLHVTSPTIEGVSTSTEMETSADQVSSLPTLPPQSS